ncbi:lipoteichoic acid synthase [Striga asiatica]|uniref:Lipoteichoic acid synthase n=1 Tax=Striga asiatica TaxID=4170 RepID=A0A5A7QXK3_STRAF|nr:lipoteichoic acid synthase [Striga asiatica]
MWHKNGRGRDVTFLIFKSKWFDARTVSVRWPLVVAWSAARIWYFVRCGFQEKQQKEVDDREIGAMVLGGLMKGEPLVAKLAAAAKYGVLPAAMIAALVYSPPDFVSTKKPANSGS